MRGAVTPAAAVLLVDAGDAGAAAGAAAVAFTHFPVWHTSPPLQSASFLHVAAAAGFAESSAAPSANAVTSLPVIRPLFRRVSAPRIIHRRPAGNLHFPSAPASASSHMMPPCACSAWATPTIWADPT